MENSKIKINVLHLILVYFLLNIIVFCISFYIESIVLERNFISLLRVFYEGQAYDEDYVITFKLAVVSPMATFLVFMLLITFPVKSGKKIADYFELT